MNGRACVFVRASAVRMCTVPVRVLGMNGRACSFVRASAVRMCTVPVLGLGMVANSLPGGPEFTLGLCATFSRVYVRYGVRLGQCEQCILYVCVCVYGGRHVQPERCTTRREYVYTCVVQYMEWWLGRRG